MLDYLKYTKRAREVQCFRGQGLANTLDEYWDKVAKEIIAAFVDNPPTHLKTDQGMIPLAADPDSSHTFSINDIGEIGENNHD